MTVVPPRPATCDAMTGQMNCGCCETTYLGCDLAPGHPGPMHFYIVDAITPGRGSRTSRLATYHVYWTEAINEPPSEGTQP